MTFFTIFRGGGSFFKIGTTKRLIGRVVLVMLHITEAILLRYWTFSAQSNKIFYIVLNPIQPQGIAKLFLDNPCVVC